MGHKWYCRLEIHTRGDKAVRGELNDEVAAGVREGLLLLTC